jgi:hypothetical protein
MSRMTSSFLFGLSVCCLSTDNIVMWIHEVQLAFLMKCDLVHEDLKDVFPFQNIHAEDVQTDQFSKIVSRARNQQNSPNEHFIGLCR